MKFSAAKKEIKSKEDSVPKIQDKHFSDFKDYDSHEKIETDDVEKYEKKAKKAASKERKENWLKSYKIGYMARHKDQVKLRGPRIE